MGWALVILWIILFAFVAWWIATIFHTIWKRRRR